MTEYEFIKQLFFRDDVMSRRVIESSGIELKERMLGNESEWISTRLGFTFLERRGLIG